MINLKKKTTKYYILDFLIYFAQYLGYLGIDFT